MILVTAEKPSAGRDIARILGATQSKDGYMEGNGYIVTWCVGHLVTLKDPEDYDEKYKKWSLSDLPLPPPEGLKPLKSSYNQLKVVKALIERDDIEYIINAGDAGREGLLIQNRVYEYCNNKHPVKILWSSSLTDEAILKAMDHLHDPKEEEFINLYREAKARASADMVYGYNYSRLLTLLFGTPGTVLSYGRCQTPLLNMIATRDSEIKNFKSVPFWTIIAEYKEGFKGVLIDEEGNSVKFMNKEAAEDMISLCGTSGKVSSYKLEHKVQKAPSLFNLSEIQTTLGKKYGLTPNETLEIAQKLYEQYKIISYPRTDSRFLSTDLFNEITEHINCCNFGKFAPFVSEIRITDMDKAYFNNNKVSDHHALIPTINKDIPKIYESLSDIEKAFFDEIVVSLISIFMSPYEYDSTELMVDFNGNMFKSIGNHTRNEGYKSILKLLKQKKASKDEEVDEIPSFNNGYVINNVLLNFKEDKTKPPVKYSTGNIIKMMNKYSIGTSATAASIVDKLIERGFIAMDSSKKYSSTPKGVEFISIVPDELKDKDLTAAFENKLSKVNTGKLSVDDFLNEIFEDISKNIDNLKNKADSSSLKIGNSIVEIGKCPKCKGEVIEGKYGVYCKNNCGMQLGKAFNKTLSASQVKSLLEHKKVFLKGIDSSKGTKFDAYIIPDGIEESVYTDKSGAEKTIYRFKFKLEFHNNIKSKNNNK